MKLLLLVVLLLATAAASAARGRREDSQPNSVRRAAQGLYRGLCSVFGEENIGALQRFFSKITDQFVCGMDVLVETLYRIWTDLLDVLGVDASNLTHYFSPTAVTSNPTRAVLLVGAVLLAYWFLALFIGVLFSLLHAVFGRMFWIVRVILFALSCLYILQKHEGNPEQAVLPLCFVVAVYFMTGPVALYRRRNSSTLEDKIDHLEGQIRILNIRLSKLIENLDRGSDQ
ncbi:BRI3-binding protein [Latimeria chalumnae]|uniref:BRI3 binding protein n=1 Tax=Latimeria chalumnae TaxID=7897 RepID=H3AVH4_LATCH|nr:PREDICTED: BRI3-binding protein [Latimeria chalumnae]|eukprot:XP_005988983.1 PREDICTED: BRI3-binding protein [Latimeria chalumnae]